MKNLKFSKLMLAFTLVVLTIGMLMYTSCKKQEVNGGRPDKKELTAVQKQRILDAINAIPDIKVKAGKYGFTLPKTLKDGGFNFADPSNGYQFATSSNVEFVETSEGNYMIVSTDGTNANAGGMVVAGESNLDINMAICFSSASDGSSLFDFGSVDSTYGFSMVLGISGDFESLINGDIDPDADITEYIYGFAMYIVFEDQANGSYEVIDFTDPSSFTDDVQGQAVSMLIDFRKAKMYISSEGNLTVGTNTISFNGKYFEVEYDPNGNTNEGTPSEVSGFGTMGCM